jgi:hypothetical protein
VPSYEAKPQPTGNGGRTRAALADAIAGIERRFLHHQLEADQLRRAEPPHEPDKTAPMAADFRELMADHEPQEELHRQQYRRAAADARRLRVADLIDHHISEESWRGLMHQARQAAERDEEEFLLLRFPTQLCSDAGRTINVGEPNWPATLRGEAAEIYLRWERDLKPHGFGLRARVLEFPGRNARRHRAVPDLVAVTGDRLTWINAGSSGTRQPLSREGRNRQGASRSRSVM